MGYPACVSGIVTVTGPASRFQHAARRERVSIGADDGLVCPPVWGSRKWQLPERGLFERLPEIHGGLARTKLSGVTSTGDTGQLRPSRDRHVFQAVAQRVRRFGQTAISVSPYRSTTSPSSAPIETAPRAACSISSGTRDRHDARRRQTVHVLFAINEDHYIVGGVRVRSGNYSLDRPAVDTQVHAHRRADAGRSEQFERPRCSSRAAGRDRSHSEERRHVRGADVDQVSQKKVCDALLMLNER